MADHFVVAAETQQQNDPEPEREASVAKSASQAKPPNDAHVGAPSLVRNSSSEMRMMLMKRPASASSMMIPRELLRYRSESLSIEPRLSIYSTSGMTYESMLVVGHMVGSDNVVYYLLEVRSWENPLEGYVVRRRYNDFKKLHSELSEFMPTSKPRSNSSTTGGLLYRSLLCNPLGSSSSSSRSSPELNPLWSPKRPDENTTSFTMAAARKQSRGSSGDDLDMSHPLGPDDDALALATTRYSVPSKPATPGITYYDTNLALPLDGVKFNLAGRAQLPDMPSGGVASIFSTQQMLIKYRVEQFNRILAAVMSDTSKDVANVLMNFIQEKPGGQATSYTSLSEYAAIDMPLRVERYARRRAMSMGRRPPLLLRDTSGGNASVSTASTSSTPASLLRSSTAS